MRSNRASHLAFLLALSLEVGATQETECLMIEQMFAQNRIQELIDYKPESPRWQALQQFRLAAAYIPDDNKKEARRAIKQGLKVVAKTLKDEPDNSEVLLMGTMLDGQLLLLSPWRFLINGTRGLSRLNRAEKLEPDNPRVTLIRGTAKVVLPAIFGGNAKEARDMFQSALDTDRSGVRFSDSPLCENGEWAQVDLMNWLGRAEEKLGNTGASKAAYRSALRFSPDNYWVKIAMEGRGYEWTEGEELVR